MRNVNSDRAAAYGALLGVGQLLVGGLSFVVVWSIAASLTLAPCVVAIVLQGSLAVPEGPRSALVWAIVALECLLGVYLSLPVARFIGRVFPVRAGARPRWGLILALLALAAPVAGGLATPPFLQEMFVQVVPLVVLIGSVITWTIVWQTRTTRSSIAPYVLFLRRFSTFADRSVLSALLSALPPGLRTVFLTPRTEALANFSPVVVAFSGTRLRRPFRSCPIPLSARDVEWEDQIEDLLRASSCVVVDASEVSPAMEREVELVRRLLPADRVLWLADRSATHPATRTGASDRVIHYQRSWRAALRRIAVESASVLFAALLLAMSLSASYPLPPWGPWLAAAVLVALAAPVILQPSVDREARRLMRSAIPEILRASAGREPVSAAGDTVRAECAVLCPDPGGKGAFLAEAVRGAALVPRLIAGTTASPRAHRDAVRCLRRAELVLADLSAPDVEVAYLLGVAHGLGRPVLPVSSTAGSIEHGEPSLQFRTGSEDSVGQLSALIAARAGEVRHPNPVAALIADEVVFAENLSARRLLAFLVDVSVAAALLAGYLLWRSIPFSFSALAPLALLLVAHRWVGMAFTGSSIGMALARIEVIDADGGVLGLGHALGRSAATYLAMFPFSASLAALYAPRHQVLEDLLAGTAVVRRSTGRPASRQGEGGTGG
jgi:hypothetical protein